MAQFLVRIGANVNALSEYGEAPLQMALRRELYGPAWSNGYKDHWNEPDNRIEYAMDMIDPDISNEGEYGDVRRWVEARRLSVLDLLLSHPDIDIAVKDLYGDTLIHCVRFGFPGSRVALKRLLDQGCDIHARNGSGHTALHLACLRRDAHAVKYLLKRGASVVDMDENGLNALHYAACGAEETCLRLILDKAVSSQLEHLVKLTDQKNRNALHHLMNSRWGVDSAVARRLVRASVEVELLDCEGNSPLAIFLQKSRAQSVHKAKIADILFSAGANPSFCTAEGSTLGHLAASAWNVGVELLGVLMVHGVNLQASDQRGRNLLHYGAFSGSIQSENVMVFLRQTVGLRIDLRDADGNTPLDTAVALSKSEGISLFRDRRRQTKRLIREEESRQAVMIKPSVSSVND